jgi:hypothetical protein
MYSLATLSFNICNSVYDGKWKLGMLDIERLRGIIRKCKLPGDGGNETNDVHPVYPLPHPSQEWWESPFLSLLGCITAEHSM